MIFIKIPPTRLIYYASPLLLASCSNDAILTTSTSVGVSVDGDVTEAVPDHASLGFRRRELVYNGKSKNSNHQSMLAKLDSTTTWLQGIAIREQSATGSAAEYIAGRQPDTVKNDPNSTPGSPSPSPISTASFTSSKPLTYLSDTTLGFKTNLIPGEGNDTANMVLGYKRKFVTRTAPNSEGTLPSTYSDVTIHAAGITQRAENAIHGGEVEDGGVPERHRLSRTINTDDSPGFDDDNNSNDLRGGIRIRQTFVLGDAAKILTTRSDFKKSTENLKK